MSVNESAISEYNVNFQLSDRTIIEQHADERHPHIEIKGMNKLSEIPLLGDENIVIHQGSQSKEITIEGACTYEDRNFIDNLSYFSERTERLQPVVMISHRGNYDILISDTSTEPAGIDEPDLPSRTYYYTINAYTIGKRDDL